MNVNIAEAMVASTERAVSGWKLDSQFMTSSIQCRVRTHTIAARMLSEG